MDRHLRLYLKSLGQNRKALDKQPAERPVSRHNILDVTSK